MDLKELTIQKTQTGLKNKSFSSVELVKSSLEQIKKENKDLNAFLTVCEKEALDQAEKIDTKIQRYYKDIKTLFLECPLLGMPVAIKDNFCTKDIKTTAGSKVLADYSPVYDATVVDKIKQAGAIIIGKTNLDAWAHGSSGENSDFGPTKNPFDRNFVPGGSSSGSAVAVASNMVLGAIGTDTGGSIRQPASFCNIVGLKPTYGRVSRYGVIAMASSLDTVGCFGKDVIDTALLLKIMAGHDDYDATTSILSVPDYPEEMKKEIKDLKIGLPKEYFTSGLDKEIKEKIEKVIKNFEKMGAKIIEISLPHTQYALAVYYIIQPSEVSSNLARYDGIRYGFDRSQFGDEAKRRIMLGTFTLSSGYYDAYYLKAMKVRTLIKKDFEEAFKKVDILLTPVSPSLPFKIGEKTQDPLKMYLSDIFTVTANLAGIPGLSLPAGLVDNLPVGFQLLGPQFSEEKLFQAAYQYKQNE
ncbi:MAG: Asp-tRNA(Asn)/Glu-tRNA(Gln) amidotransferase subunit GatA [Candidatus Shapirobacteria bacterium]|nr:Asp-tRNA(Asn)/Glu-tRNA(Gln) amidotransferase subunit GatA [Candidatus Shapirobacteria bacterium]